MQKQGLANIACQNYRMQMMCRPIILFAFIHRQAILFEYV